MNEKIRKRTKTISLSPDKDSTMKLFYLKLKSVVDFTSKHVFRKINGSYKCNDEIK